MHPWIIKLQGGYKMKTRIIIIIFFIFLFGLHTVLGNADDFDWPRWRGPNGDGISMETDWNPKALAGGTKIVWQVDVGRGYSDVVIKGKYLYTMGSRAEKDTVYCLKVKNGKKVWRFSYPVQMGSYTAATPFIDGESVYTLSQDGLLFCFNAKNGKVRWKKDLVSDLDVIRPFYGFAGSPVIEGDLIILSANTSGIALDKYTGNKVWRSDKPPENLRLGASTGPHYAAPVLYDNKGKQHAIITSYKGICSVEVATGKVLWLYEWEPYRGIQGTDPLFFNDRVYVTQYSKDHGSLLLDIGGVEPKVLWKNLDMHSEISSPVMIDGYIYGVKGGPDHGFYSFRCIYVETGEVMWEEDLEVQLIGTLQLMAADGKLIILEDDGTLHIAEATPLAYKELSSGDIFDGEEKIRQFWTPPVLYNGNIYCRNYDGDLVCIDVSK
jgi:outer membrane protein assembly factor BamB